MSSADAKKFLTADEQQLWKKSTDLAKTQVREPSVAQFYKTKLVQLIPSQPYRYTDIGISMMTALRRQLTLSKPK